MLKKTIKYTDFEGVEREEDFYFHLSKTELARLQYNQDESYTDRVTTIFRKKDSHALMRLFEELILMSYGKKSADGVSFIKDDAQTKLFMHSPAYDELYFELFSGDGSNFQNFLYAIVPKDMAAEARKAVDSGEVKLLH